MPLPVEVRVKQESLALAVLGATGDLSTKKLFPCLFQLHYQGFLPPRTAIIGYGRSEFTDTTFRDLLRGFLTKAVNAAPPSPSHGGAKSFPAARPHAGGDLMDNYALGEPRDPTPADIDAFLSICSYVRSTHNYGYIGSERVAEDAMEGLVYKLDQHMATHQSATAHNRIFYLALPFTVWPHVCEILKSKCQSKCGFNHLVLEKPFGRDTESAMELCSRLVEHFPEEQVYRIDRYLGKEIVENLLVMRFANRFFAPIWNRDNIKNVQIIFKEPFGAEDQNRTQYFDNQGIIRDVVQNHLLQVLALIAMDKPASLNHTDIRDEKLKVLRCIKDIKVEDVVVAQYVEGNGHRGYLDHPSVADDSRAPTFCMMVVYIRNERWDGVPFILKAGKGLNELRSEVRIQLRDVPGDLFSHEAGQGPNEFVLRMQPLEELYLKMTIKKPGLGMRIVPSEMQLSEEWKRVQMVKSAKGIAPRRAYARLIMDLIHGEQAHFVRDDELLAAWRVITPILEKVQTGVCAMRKYSYGSRGPDEAEELRKSTGHISSIVPKDGVPLHNPSSSVSKPIVHHFSKFDAANACGR